MSADVISSRAMQWASKVQSIADQARDLTLEAAQSVGARYADETKAIDINKLLEGRSDREKIDGMRRTISKSSRGVDMSEHFASVVKNVASANLELRKLVYIYITRYAESQPDLALLSINTIQKALSDQNQIVRALALRVMSSIRVPSISGIVDLSIKKCCSDSSSFVRKTAAIAITKTNALNPDLRTRLIEYLKVLLADDAPTVIASALETYEKVCPDRAELLHPSYRRICSSLSQMDEFNQVSVLRILEIYARTCFTSPQQVEVDKPSLEGFYDQTTQAGSLDADLSLLLKSAQSLLRSPNSAVVIAASRVLCSLGPEAQRAQITSPLVGLLRQSSDIKYIVLTNIVILVIEDSSVWSKFSKHFLIYPTEAECIWRLKLEIITLIINLQNADLLLSELAQYSKELVNESFAREAIKAIGRCAQHMPELADRCLKMLFEHLDSDSGVLIGESVIAIRLLIQLNPHGHVKHIKTLIRSLSNISASAARASIFWLVSENLELLTQLAPDVLRIGAKGFADEEEDVRLQILTLAVKMYVIHCQHSNDQDVEEMHTAIQEVDEAHAAQDHEEITDAATINDSVTQDTATQDISKELPDIDSPIPKLYAYIIQLARYDRSYDLRDRLRTYKILASSPSWVLTQKLLFSPKPLPAFATPSADKAEYAIGSSSLAIGSEVNGYTQLPPWSDKIVGQKEREVDVKASVAKQFTNKSSPAPTRATTPTNAAVRLGNENGEASSNKTKSKLTGISSLDDFYATTSEEEESSTDQAEESGATQTSEEGDETDEEEEEEEEEIEEESSDSGSEEEELLVKSKR